MRRVPPAGEAGFSLPEVLIAMAYAYFASGFIGELMGRSRKAVAVEHVDTRRAKDAS